MSLPLSKPPESVCLLRLSAIGDICHMLPVIRTLQQHWPHTRLTWIIGKTEYGLVNDISGIEFIIHNKAAKLSAYRQLHQQMRGRHFDILLHMQMSLRASLASLLIPADIRLGFDRRRANDFQWLFTNHQIPYKDKQHVMDSFFEFIGSLGINERKLEWNIPIAPKIRKTVNSRLPVDHFMVVSPCSSMAYRNWTVEGYAAVADYAMEKYGLPTVLTGGPESIEQEYGEKISRLCKHKPANLIGQTSLKQLLVVLEKALVVIAPDSGPAHMAIAVNTPVIGLYATTNPDRARPYLHPELVVNRYPEAVYEKYGKSVEAVAWGTRVRDAGTMERISPSDVTQKLDQLLDG
jgi:heptosyltransferase I